MDEWFLDRYDSESIVKDVRKKILEEDEGKKQLRKIKKYWGKDLREYKAIEEMPFYVEYLSKFNGTHCDYDKGDMEDAFDFDLLFRLVAGSFSSSWRFEYSKEEKAFRLAIDVSAGTKRVRKYLDSLFAFQIKNMYAIYLQEQISLDLLGREENMEKEIVDSTRNDRLEKYYRETEQCFRKKLYLLLKGEKQ